MPDERMKLLTLDRWGTANLDKWWEKMGMISSWERGENRAKMELCSSREKWRRLGQGRLYRELFSPGWYN